MRNIEKKKKRVKFYYFRDMIFIKVLVELINYDLIIELNKFVEYEVNLFNFLVFI